LGWDGDTTRIFTGSIDAIERGIGRMEVLCLGNQHKLMRTSTDKTFINQSAGEVIRALAGGADIETETIEDGIKLPVYLADSSRGAYDHCLWLARRCGFDLYTTQKGRLVFSKFAVSMADHTFRYGEHIIDASIDKGTPLDKVIVVPESPASSSGDDTASWLIKDPSPQKGEAGNGSVCLFISDPLLRTKEGAESTANALLYLNGRDALAGYVELMGSPEIRLGEAVKLEGMPDAGMDALYQVMAIRHCLNHSQGFRTIVALGGMP
jgi:hypothetical protein